MKLLLRRDIARDTKGFIKQQVVVTFLLHARIELTPEENDLIVKFGLGEKIFYKQPLHLKNPDITLDLTIALLQPGHNMNVTDYVEMLDVEGELKASCEKFARLLKMAAEFQKEEVFEY